MKKTTLVLTTAILTACATSNDEKSAFKDEHKDKDETTILSQHDSKPLDNKNLTVANRKDSSGQPSSKKENELNDSEQRFKVAAQPVEAQAIMQEEVSMGTSVALRHVNRPMPSQEPYDNENYQHFESNPIQRVTQNPVSTFSIDVDTGSYANVRRILNSGQMPRHDAVRLEEMINYFDYQYPLPESKSLPFSTFTEIAPSPWNSNAHLVHIGIQGYDVPAEQRPNANLVFLVDVSGSMNSPDKIGLLKSSLKLLTKQMRENDSISIVVYAGAAGTVLEPTKGTDQAKIIASLDGLTAGGSTNGAAGIHLAYQLAEQQLIKDGINRIIIATDGDFNVGTTNFEALKELVEEKRKTGVSLTTLGFGSGNYNDHLMEQLADVGNGNHAYIDGIKEANKVLVNEMNSTLFTIAKDVKIQVEFNPHTVSEYRLVGYENRKLKNEDFNNDKIDAGEIGAGHNVTAIYEIVLTDAKKGWLEPLRYQHSEVTTNGEKELNTKSNELAEIRIRYKTPDSDSSELIKWPISKNEIQNWESTSDDFRFASAVAAFGQLLRGGEMTENFAYADVLSVSRAAKGADDYGYRGEFIQLVSLAQSLAQ